MSKTATNDMVMDRVDQIARHNESDCVILHADVLKELYGVKRISRELVDGIKRAANGRFTVYCQRRSSCVESVWLATNSYDPALWTQRLSWHRARLDACGVVYTFVSDATMLLNV